MSKTKYLMSDEMADKQIEMLREARRHEPNSDYAEVLPREVSFLAVHTEPDDPPTQVITYSLPRHPVALEAERSEQRIKAMYAKTNYMLGQAQVHIADLLGAYAALGGDMTAIYAIQSQAWLREFQADRERALKEDEHDKD